MPAEIDLLCFCDEKRRTVMDKNKNEKEKNKQILVFKGVQLIIQNIDDTITKDILRQKFERFGKILKIEIITKDILNPNKIIRRYATLSFISPADAARAIQCMNGKIIIENTLFVSLMSDKTRRRRPSPSPYLQQQYTIGIHMNNLPSRRKLSVQELSTQRPWMIKRNISTSPGGSLVDFKRRMSLC